VPLDKDGLIDEEAIARNPSWATVSRYWASEPDQHERIERENEHWVFPCRKQDIQAFIRIPSVPFRLHEQLVFESPDGVTHAFTVASIRGLRPPSRKRP
jgi:hypothetical protein